MAPPAGIQFREFWQFVFPHVHVFVIKRPYMYNIFAVLLGWVLAGAPPGIRTAILLSLGFVCAYLFHSISPMNQFIPAASRWGRDPPSCNPAAWQFLILDIQ